MANDTDKLTLHFMYSVLILLMVLIAVATDRWTSQAHFTEYLGNAATMTSLVLGLVAIFYSFISNDSLSKSLGSITTVSSEVKESKEQITRYLDLTKNATIAGAESAELLERASNDITLNLSSLTSTLNAISEKNDALQSLVSNLPSRFEQLEVMVGDVAKAIGEKPQSAAGSRDGIDSQAVDVFLSRASLSNNLLTYACVLAAKKKQELSIAAVCEAISLKAPNTLNGFLHCMNAIRLLTSRAVTEKEKVYLITDVHPTLDSKTKPYFVEYIEDTYADKPEQKDAWLKKLSNVEAIFSC